MGIIAVHAAARAADAAAGLDGAVEQIGRARIVAGAPEARSAVARDDIEVAVVVDVAQGKRRGPTGGGEVAAIPEHSLAVAQKNGHGSWTSRWAGKVERLADTYEIHFAV